MFRQLNSSEAGAPDSFFVPFLGRVVSLNKPKQLFILTSSYIAAPPTTATWLATSIPFITPAPVTFSVPSFIRVSTATLFNSAGLIEAALVKPRALRPRIRHLFWLQYHL